ncbi:NmrA-like family domain-containing protein 1 [Ceratobasidium sp. AG-Ba]|nr:NmrA-like family domain-containing protein 1 [Ceratobasidium sp. AG-Ba]
MSPAINKPIIAVCGATGFQGGSVIKHLLQDGRFAVRGLTRNLNSAQAKELTRQGIPLVKADFDDLPSLCKAFKGCYGVYGVTDYFDALDRETQQGINIVDAAKVAGIKHLVFSSGDDTPYDVPYINHKAAATAHMRKSGVPSTALYLTWYFSNVFLAEAIRRNPMSGGWISKFPFPLDTPIPSISPRDIGAYALGAFANPAEWIGQDMRPCNELITPRQYAEVYGEVTGSQVDIIETTREEVLNQQIQPFPEIFKWFLDMHEGRFPPFSPELAARLCPDKQTWRDFMIEHATIPMEQPMVVQCYVARELSL